MKSGSHFANLDSKARIIAATTRSCNGRECDDAGTVAYVGDAATFAVRHLRRPVRLNGSYERLTSFKAHQPDAQARENV
jgi:hypothetical protein